MFTFVLLSFLTVFAESLKVNSEDKLNHEVNNN